MVIRDKRYYENRIQLLTNRGRDNGRIVKKLMRKLRNIEKEEQWDNGCILTRKSVDGNV